MNPSIKNALGVFLVLALVVASGALVQAVRTYARAGGQQTERSFTVFSTGEAVAVPDVAAFTFTVITEGGKDVAALQSENAKKANAANAFVKDAGVEDEDIRTSRYAISPRYESRTCTSSSCPPPTIVGYSITQGVRVKVRAFEKAGALLAGVVERGANSVSQLSFTVDDPDEVQNAARADAVAKAKEKAQTLAKAGGFRLGRILKIEDSTVTPSSPYARTLELGAADAAVAPSIEPGSQEVRITVSVQYEIL